MILLDANLLLIPFSADDPRSARAAAWLERTLTDEPRVALPWATLLAFLRIATSPRVFQPPLAVERAWEQVEDWLDVESVWVPEPTPHHRRTLAMLVRKARPSGNLIPDAHLAALALDHGLVVCTSDSDFAAFPGVRWKNPLADE